MSIKVEKKKKVKKPVDRETKISRRILLIGLLIVMIPVGALGFILVQASRGQNTPANGSRFSHDLTPAITSAEISTIKSSISSISGVEAVEADIITGTLRVSVDVKDSSSKSEIETITKSVYSAVDKTCPVLTYFTASSSKRMYDLNINVYNKIDNEDGKMIQGEITKNSSAENYSFKFVVEPEEIEASN